MEPIQEDQSRFESGKICPGKRDTPNWKLHTGDGERTYTEHINFVKKFDATPIVIVAITAQDILTDSDHRINVTSTNVDQNGFDIQINTWGDSQIWSASVGWFAYDKSFSVAAGKLIQSGKENVKRSTPGFKLNSGKGDRNFTLKVPFPKHFMSPPSVWVSFALLDVGNETDHRVTTYVSNVKTDSFDLVIGTWSDTSVFGVTVAWLAFEKSFEAPGPGLKLQTGRQSFKKDSEPAYSLHKNQGDRSIKRRIKFNTKFGENPSVLTSFCQLDVIRDQDHRVVSTAENIAPDAVDIKLGTWKDTVVWSSSISWLAFGKGVEPVIAKPPAPVSNVNKEENEEPPAKKAKIEGNGSNSKEEEDESKECKICFDNRINCVLIPCGHLCVCSDCAQVLTKHKHSSECPICKSKIKSVHKTYLS